MDGKATDMAVTIGAVIIGAVTGTQPIQPQWSQLTQAIHLYRPQRAANAVVDSNEIMDVSMFETRIIG